MFYLVILIALSHHRFTAQSRWCRLFLQGNGTRCEYLLGTLMEILNVGKLDRSFILEIWWHISAITCQIIMLTCQIFLHHYLTSRHNYLKRRHYHLTSRHHYLTRRHNDLASRHFIWQVDITSVSYTHLTLPTICSV